MAAKKMAEKHKNDHNSLNFQARSSRLCMVVNVDHLQFFFFKKQNGRRNTKLFITHSIFKLGAYAWQYTLNFCKKKSKNKMTTKKTSLPPKHKIDHNSLNFQARSLTFCKKHSKNKMAAKKQDGRQNTKLIVTHSIFKLGAPDFAW